jgi:hypothetical protein
MNVLPIGPHPPDQENLKEKCDVPSFAAGRYTV